MSVVKGTGQNCFLGRRSKKVSFWGGGPDVCGKEAWEEIGEMTKGT